MGFWGYYPSDNDDAWDLKDSINSVINSKLEQIFTSKLYTEKNVAEFLMKRELLRQKREKVSAMWARVGVIQNLLQTGIAVNKRFVDECVKYLAEIEKEMKFFSKGWKDKNKFIKVFAKVKEAFIKLSYEYNDSVTVLVDRGWLRRLWEKPGASWPGCVEAVEKDMMEEP